jgi:archaeal flagellar protein FlaG
MSAETFTTAMFLITAVLAAGVLINAVFPVVYNMASTFQSATHESDQRLRTDFKIVATQARDSSPNYAEVWIKNIGTSSVPLPDITNRSDVFCGLVGQYQRITYDYSTASNTGWYAELSGTTNAASWDPGETLKITAYCPNIPSTGQDGTIYFQFILPDGIWRSTEFTASPGS